jgi:hypothetical protein
MTTPYIFYSFVINNAKLRLLILNQIRLKIAFLIKILNEKYFQKSKGANMELAQTL